MSATVVRRGVEQNGASSHCLIEILTQFGWRVFIIRRRLSRLKKQIQIAEKKNQPTTTLESRKEGLSDELDRFEDLLNSCLVWTRDRTGIPSSKLVEIAMSPAFTDGEDWDHIYAELRTLDKDRVTAELWKALLSLDQDALVSVKLLSSSESSPPASETAVSALKGTVATGEDETSPLAIKNLQKCQQRAYRAFQFAESRLERQLEDRTAWDYLKEHGIPKDHDDLQDLQSYALPSLETFTTYLSHARRVLGELKYEKGKRRQSKSVAKRSEID